MSIFQAIVAFFGGLGRAGAEEAAQRGAAAALASATGATSASELMALNALSKGTTGAAFGVMSASDLSSSEDMGADIAGLGITVTVH